MNKAIMLLSSTLFGKGDLKIKKKQNKKQNEIYLFFKH
jgi:hypothetical protein